ncbi:fumarylacetoacetate hydrolase family protein [Mycolicibacterium sp.]|uniref:fumarylacetoacetate hydrolase family protein n=1 Tax=Mycolicibacterium sp. TaxID=2320850 RepID=UPI003D11DDC4
MIRYAEGDESRWGLVEDDEVFAADGDLAGGLRIAGRVGRLPEMSLLAPVAPRNVVAIGRNYADHARELGNALPTTPMVFLKSVSSVVGPGADIISPAATDMLQHEAEIAVVIGRTARRVSRREAPSVVLGYTLANDVTARDLQRTDVGITLAKGFDTFCPIGPWIDTDVDLDTLTVQAEVDGELRQDGKVADMVFPIPVLIEFVTQFLTLEPGDVILTGTPSGVGSLLPGNTVTVRSPALGQLTNRVVAEQPDLAGVG